LRLRENGDVRRAMEAGRAQEVVPESIEDSADRKGA
jgi:hypothetical protein